MQILFNCKIKTWDIENHLKHNHFIIALNITSWIEKKKKCISLNNMSWIIYFYFTGYCICFCFIEKKKSDMTGPVILVKRAGNEKHRAS